MMKLVYKKSPNNVMTENNVRKIAQTLYGSTGRVYINTKADPYDYLRMLQKEYGIDASAKPRIRNRRIVGYHFKNAV